MLALPPSDACRDRSHPSWTFRQPGTGPRELAGSGGPAAVSVLLVRSPFGAGPGRPPSSVAGPGRRRLLVWQPSDIWKVGYSVLEHDTAARYLQSIKTLLTLELSQYRKSGSTFSSSEPVAARSDCRRLGNALCLCSLVRPAQAQELGR